MFEVKTKGWCSEEKYYVLASRNLDDLSINDKTFRDCRDDDVVAAFVFALGSAWPDLKLRNKLSSFSTL
jgi:hypothetical protein